MHEIDKILARWQEYCTTLYRDDPTNRDAPALSGLGSIELEPDILESEVIGAMSKLSDGRAAGCDDVTPEMLKSLGDT